MFAQPFSEVQHFKGGAPDITINWTVSNLAGTKKSIEDVVTKGFSKAQSRGAIINSPALFYEEELKYVHSPKTISVPDQYVPQGGLLNAVHSGCNIGAPAVPWANLNVDVSRLKMLAATQCVAGIASPTAESLAFLGELQGTIATLLDPFKSIDDYVKREVQRYSTSKGKSTRQQARYRGQKTGSLSRGSKAASDQHLSIIFGILPAMSDVENMLKALLQETRSRRTARGFATDSMSTTWTRNWEDDHVTGTLTGTCTRIVSVRAGCLYDIASETGLDRLGFSIREIPNAALELTRMSFVLNWFVNVQNFLGALIPVTGVQRRAQWLTVIDEFEATETLGSCVKKLQNPWQVAAGGDKVTQKVKTISRVPANLDASIGLTYKGKSLNTDQVLASISLITQRLSSLGAIKAL
jgi:hypothetical protein